MTCGGRRRGRARTGWPTAPHRSGGGPAARGPSSPSICARRRAGDLRRRHPPKSTFQIGGAGAVGTGIRPRHAPPAPAAWAGFGIWPFDPASAVDRARDLPPPLDRDRSARATSSSEPATSMSARGRSARAFATSMVGSEDAFDAAISALVMHDHLADLDVCGRPPTP